LPSLVEGVAEPFVALEGGSLLNVKLGEKYLRSLLYWK